TARDLTELGFDIIATTGTTKELKRNGIKVNSVFKVGEGRPNVVDSIKNDEISLVINTPMGATARYDEESIGRACIKKGIQVITTLSGAEAAVRAIRLNGREIKVKSIQEYHS
ncbi:MAG: carbamoyl phosphate synthase large subunit, partial [Candidatus Marinimicrobia bacterium]|nr:carbamoyl phosphate synthase large subunit [Candidatus Neomarinimicrobiota bacterium]